MLFPPINVGEVALATSNAGSVRVMDVVVEHPFASVTVYAVGFLHRGPFRSSVFAVKLFGPVQENA